MQFTGSNPDCFPHGRMTQTVTDNDLLAHDAGTIACTATINGSNYTSKPFTLRISGEHWCVYCTCTVICSNDGTYVAVTC